MSIRKERLKPRSVSLAFYNAHDIKSQVPLVSDFLSRHQVDIMLVQESLLKPGIRDPKIANYQLVRNDRIGRPGGGTLIYHKRSLHCIPLDPPPTTNLEVSVVRLAMTGHAPLIIASCYLSPLRTLLSSDIEAILSLGSSVILAGDFNSKNVLWSCNSTNPNGKILESLADSLSFDVIPPMSPTHFPYTVSHRPDILDMALLKNVTLQLRSIETLYALSSDHLPVLMHLGPPIVTTPPTKTVVQWYKLEKALESTHSPALARLPDDIRSVDDITVAVDSLTNHVTTALSESSKQVPVTEDRRRALPDDVRRLITEKNAAIRHYCTYPSELNRKRMRAFDRLVKSRVRDHRNNEWDKRLSDIKPGHLAFWELTRSMKADTVSVLPPLTRPNQTRAFDDDEKAECLAESLESQCTPSSIPVDPAHLDSVDAEVERLASVSPSVPLTPTKASEVQAIIKGLRPRKAPGADGISNKVLKLFPTALIYLLVSIFNAAMDTCSFPDAWKEATVIGIPKPGKNATEPSSYRPISLLSSLGKIYERLLLNRLWSHVHEHKLLPNEQFGFRARHSCPQQVLRLTEHVLTQRSGVWPADTGAVFLDVAKAFDKVWHNGLIYKLSHLRVPDRLVLIIRDFLRNRSFRYRVEGALSSPRPIRAGVPQGSALSPLLFTLYTSDIPRTPQVEIALFADDTALYSSDSNQSRVRIRLQRALDELGVWFRKWRIEVNPTKSAAVYFTRSNRLPSTPTTLFDQPIPWVKSARYLGVTLDRRLSFAEHIRVVANRAKHYASRFHSLLCKKSKMSLRNKLILYKTCIRPVMTYSSVAFAHSPHVKKLQIVQNKFLRKATGAPWFTRNIDLHRDTELESIASFMKLASRRYYDSAAHHPNPLVNTFPDYCIEPLDGYSLRRPRHVLGDPDDAITSANAEEVPPSHSHT